LFVHEGCAPVASLYLGVELATLSKPKAAQEQYEHAAHLYPAAQSPLLALSHLAHSSGDSERAFEALQQIFALKPPNPSDNDPWWNYDLSHVREAEELVSKAFEGLGESSP
jgi:tetratricopeptide (TPR) repeat protein